MTQTIDIEATKDKLRQIATAPKKLKGTDEDKRRILLQWCDRADIVPVYSGARA